MKKLGSIEFDNHILDTLRDDKLVVFAGAGVSMGSPSNLPNFQKLTCEIAQGTGLNPTEPPPDLFLGQLHDKRVQVHKRAARLLSCQESEPHSLHQDLLRLFRTVERVRLVTTNFDLHFETAANTLFGALPKVYRAPALPLGYNFTGIVHVHGALPDTQDLVLTDADFGRAYLTDGWARRFLVNVFHQFTVLFVGYSHNDVIMRYLARALSVNADTRRFALTDEVGDWKQLGIDPILFTKGADEKGYKKLYDRVHRLAELTSRDASTWQKRIEEIGSRIPTAATDLEVEQALREVHTTCFFTNSARGVEWLRWLNERKHLDALFGNVDLSKRGKLLARWLAKHFAIAHADTVFKLVTEHGLPLNPEFWALIIDELHANKNMEESDFKRWVKILLASVPNQAAYHPLFKLALLSANHNAVPLTLEVFLTMSGQILNDNAHDDTYWYYLNEIWTKHIKPHLASVALQLLSGITRRLADIHDKLSALGEASGYFPSAIEPHEQNKINPKEPINVLINAARDTLEWLATDAPVLLDGWVEMLATADAPLLRRLAIHAITVHPGKSADDRLNWLLTHIGLHAIPEHHEVHRAAALSYRFAGNAARQAVVDAVLAHQQQPSAGFKPAEERTSRSHFDWLTWLLRAKPDCAAAEAALAPIRATYPDWQPSEHPDFLCFYSSLPRGQSPWSIEQILARTPGEQLDDLLDFQSENLFKPGPDRNGLIATIRDVCKQNTPWAFNLAEALAEKSLWTSDLWPAVIEGLEEAELSPDDWRKLLAISAKTELLSAHTYAVAKLLDALCKQSFALELLEQANAIASSLWRALHTVFLFDLNKSWTRKHLIPLFSDKDPHKFVQAWDGFLSSSKEIPPTLVEELRCASLGAQKRISKDLPDDLMPHFIGFYIWLAVWHVADPTNELLPAIFQHGSMEDRIKFSRELLGSIQKDTKKQVWDTWLRKYWWNRLDGVPAPLDEGEIRVMLEWLTHLGEKFPEASQLAVRAPIIQIECSDLPEQLCNSDLVTRYPTETAELLIYLCKCCVSDYHAADLRKVAARLTVPPLDEQLQRRLDEALARLG